MTTTTTTNEPLAAAFRELRAAWFDFRLRVPPHPRSWEDSFDESSRESNNARLREIYDQQTELIIQGDSLLLVAPTCSADLMRKP